MALKHPSQALYFFSSSVLFQICQQGVFSTFAVKLICPSFTETLSGAVCFVNQFYCSMFVLNLGLYDGSYLIEPFRFDLSFFRVIHFSHIMLSRLFCIE